MCPARQMALLLFSWPYDSSTPDACTSHTGVVGEPCSRQRHPDLLVSPVDSTQQRSSPGGAEIRQRMAW